MKFTTIHICIIIFVSFPVSFLQAETKLLNDDLLKNIIATVDPDAYKKMRDDLVNKLTEHDLNGFKSNDILAEAMLAVIKLHKFHPELVESFFTKISRNGYFPKSNELYPGSFAFPNSGFYRVESTLSRPDYFLRNLDLSLWETTSLPSPPPRVVDGVMRHGVGGVPILKNESINQEIINNNRDRVYWGKILILEYFLKFMQDLYFQNIFITPEKLPPPELVDVGNEQYWKSSFGKNQPLKYYGLFDKSNDFLFSHLNDEGLSLYWVTIMTIFSRDIHVVESMPVSEKSLQLFKKVSENIVMSKPPAVHIFLKQIKDITKNVELNMIITELISSLESSDGLQVGTDQKVDWLKDVFNADMGKPKDLPPVGEHRVPDEGND